LFEDCSHTHYPWDTPTDKYLGGSSLVNALCGSTDEVLGIIGMTQRYRSRWTVVPARCSNHSKDQGNPIGGMCASHWQFCATYASVFSTPRMPFGAHFGKNIKILCKLTQMARDSTIQILVKIYMYIICIIGLNRLKEKIHIFQLIKIILNNGCYRYPFPFLRYPSWFTDAHKFLRFPSIS
jgi:hypothetical protein